MNNFLTNPNLPQSKLKTVICGSKNKIITNYTKSFGIEIVESNLNTTVDERISDHTDISVHHLGGNIILLDYTQKELAAELSKLGMDITLCGDNSRQMRKYPKDCSLNCARINDRLFAKKNSIEWNLSDYAEKNNIKIINVNQGYSKCSILVTGDNSFITDDESIYKKGIEHGLDCIKINKGSVKLDGFNYGFIGGCGGLINKNHLIFFGDITKHTDHEKIMKFLIDRNIEFDYLKDYPLTDIGGFVPIIEE